jgi:hypothetical protein
MKIQVVKKGNSLRVMDPCPYVVEVPPEAKKK